MHYKQAKHEGIADRDAHSVNAFIPLSKCHRIRQINLYQMFGNIRFDEVLRPFRNLEHLAAFAFPRNTDFGNVLDCEKIPWAPNLQQVTLSGSFSTQRTPCGEHFVRDWPALLQHVVLDNFRGLRDLYGDPNVVSGKLKPFQSVHITDRNHHLYNQNLVVYFSGVRYLSLPANIAETNYSAYLVRPVLEQLEIRRKSEDGPHPFLLSDLVDHVGCIPTLQQIRLHSSLVEGDKTPLEVADTLLKTRAQDKIQEDGTTTINLEDAGVFVFNH